MVEAKYMLSLMYGNVAGFQYKGLHFHVRCFMSSLFNSRNILDLSEKLLQRKIDLCRSILKVYDAIDPGETNQRLNALFELNCATIIQTKIKFQSQNVKRDEAIVGKHLLRLDSETIKEFSFRLQSTRI